MQLIIYLDNVKQSLYATTERSYVKYVHTLYSHGYLEEFRINDIILKIEEAIFINTSQETPEEFTLLCANAKV